MKRKAEDVLFVSETKKTKYELSSPSQKKKKKKKKHQPIVALTEIKKLVSNTTDSKSANNRRRKHKPKKLQVSKQTKVNHVSGKDKNVEEIEIVEKESQAVPLQFQQKHVEEDNSTICETQNEISEISGKSVRKLSNEWDKKQKMVCNNFKAKCEEETMAVGVSQKILKKKPKNKTSSYEICESLKEISDITDKSMKKDSDKQNKKPKQKGNISKLKSEQKKMPQSKKTRKKKQEMKESSWRMSKTESVKKLDISRVQEVKDTVNKEDRVLLPGNQESYSSNWKKLMNTVLKKKSNGVKKTGKWMKKKDTEMDTVPKAQKKEEIILPDQNKVPDIWFDDVDDILIDTLKPKGPTSDDRLVKPFSYEGVTKIVAMDCEMIGVGDKGEEDMLARVSVVNQHGQCLYDKFVKPVENVVDYRTKFSGVRPEDLEDGEKFSTVQKEVADLLKGRILVGHAIHNDLRVLYLDHPKKMIRDTSRYKPFRKLFGGRLPSLKKLSDQVLKVQVQQGEHNSVQDSQAAMRLYTMYRQQWEKELKAKLRKLPKVNSGKNRKKS